MSAKAETASVRLKRAYEPASPEDGRRVLIDRLWPRGIRKEALALDAWLKEAAPSAELRRWFGHDPARWAEFRRRYKAELARRPEALAELRRLAGAGTLTLVYGARDAEHNDAVILKELLARG